MGRPCAPKAGNKCGAQDPATIEGKCRYQVEQHDKQIDDQPGSQQRGRLTDREGSPQGRRASHPPATDQEQERQEQHEDGQVRRLGRPREIRNSLRGCAGDCSIRATPPNGQRVMSSTLISNSWAMAQCPSSWAVPRARRSTRSRPRKSASNPRPGPNPHCQTAQSRTRPNVGCTLTSMPPMVVSLNDRNTSGSFPHIGARATMFTLQPAPLTCMVVGDTPSAQ